MSGRAHCPSSGVKIKSRESGPIINGMIVSMFQLPDIPFRDTESNKMVSCSCAQKGPIPGSMEGDKVPAELAGWSVRKSQLNRDKRGLDSVTFASFWNGLDEWMSVHKRELLPQGDP